MIQPNHSGAYEYLWFEHKYAIMAVSLKAFKNTGSKLGKNPKTFAFLNDLFLYSISEKPELETALLNVYMHIKPLIGRKERFKLIEAILYDKILAKQMLYEYINKYNQRYLQGCRLFFAPDKALYKFWDKDDYPGLWLCFGPFQIHLPLFVVINKMAQYSGIDYDDIVLCLQKLKNGISENEFATYSNVLKEQLMHNNMVVLAGNLIGLHPRIPIENICNASFDYEFNYAVAAGLIQEKIWDSIKDKDLRFPYLCDFKTFKKFFETESFYFVNKGAKPSLEESYEFLINMFYEQKQIENGKKRL